VKILLNLTDAIRSADSAAVFINRRKLCFENGSFDIGYSSAVIEVIEVIESVEGYLVNGAPDLASGSRLPAEVLFRPQSHSASLRSCNQKPLTPSLSMPDTG
jgi:hypothetical protein